MTMPFFRLMGQLFVAVETWDTVPDVREKMSKVGGLTKDQVEKGRELVRAGEELVERAVAEGGENRIALHNLHVAVGELETWFQTIKAGLRGRDVPAEVIDTALDHDLHAHDHAVTATAMALRCLGVLRTDARIEAAYEGRMRSLNDQVMLGQTLMAKAADCGDILLATRTGVSDEPVGVELEAHRSAMIQWVEALKMAAAKVGEPALLGLVGYLPDGVGRPAGGASFAVPLHQRAQREAPDPSLAGNGSGWSIGRQGRNRENLGKGFITPSFD